MRTATWDKSESPVRNPRYARPPANTTSPIRPTSRVLARSHNQPPNPENPMFSSAIAASTAPRVNGPRPSPSVTVTHPASGQERRLSTDSSGNYVAAALSVGEYTIRAELPNFKTQIRAGIVLQVGDRVRVDMVMELGEVTEQITVTEAVPLMRTTNAEVSEVITNQRIVDLPLNGRQFVQLTLLSDNVYLSPVGNRGAALAQTGRQVLVGGQRAGHNMYFLDGVSITDQYFNNLVAW